MRERPFNDLRALTAALGEALVPFMDRPFAFFGHSNGGLMAFELTRLLRRQGRALPLHLAASGRPAPQVDLQAPTTYDLPDAEFVEMLRRFNGTPEEVLANEELMALMTPILRADFALGETYVYTPEPPLALPISAFGGRMDAEVPAWTVDAWREQAAASFRAVMFAGGHFFVHENLHHVVGELTADLRRAMNAAGGHAGSADG
jgi:medium-chain acyl-[acyl-carrier-protein] hydrolase